MEPRGPGVNIYGLAKEMAPPAVFAFWPPMLYFIFIVLSTLRLDFWLSLWTGAVAAVQQLVLALWLVPIEAAADRPGGTIYYHAHRSVVLLLAGPVAALGAPGLRPAVRPLGGGLPARGTHPPPL